MSSQSQKRIYSIILFSLALSPLSTVDSAPALADGMKSTAHSTTNHHFFGDILHHISGLLSHKQPSDIMNSASTQIQKTHTLMANTSVSATQSTPVWEPKTIKVTALPENQPFVGLPASQPQHPYLDGIKSVLSSIANILPEPIPTLAHKLGIITPPDPPTIKPLWSGLDATHYSGPIPQQSGIPMQAVHLDPHLMTPDAGQGYRILYSTTNVNNDPAVSTAEILLPKGQAPAGGWKVIDWAHGTTGVNDSSTPSATNRYDAPYLNHFLKEGYAVVSSDYVGQGTPGIMAYLAEKSEGLNVNDALIAAEKIQGLPLNKTFMIDGHSQGGGAALAAADSVQQVIKGTGLDYRGAIASAPAPSLAPEAAIFGTPLANIIDKISPVTGAHALLALTAVRQYHSSGFDMDKYLTPYGKKILHDAVTETSDALTAEAASVDFVKMWTEPTYKIPGFTQAFQVTTVPTDNIKDPTLVVQGLIDDEVPAPFTALLNATTVAHGQKNIEYKYYPFETHDTINAAGTRSLEDQDKFMNERMGGAGTTVNSQSSSTAPVPPEVSLLN